jgi:hypothetical protein
MKLMIKCIIFMFSVILETKYVLGIRINDK